MNKIYFLVEFKCTLIFASIQETKEDEMVQAMAGCKWELPRTLRWQAQVWQRLSEHSFLLQ